METDSGVLRSVIEANGLLLDAIQKAEKVDDQRIIWRLSGIQVKLEELLDEIDPDWL